MDVSVFVVARTCNL